MFHLLLDNKNIDEGISATIGAWNLELVPLITKHTIYFVHWTLFSLPFFPKLKICFVHLTSYIIYMCISLLLYYHIYTHTVNKNLKIREIQYKIPEIILLVSAINAFLLYKVKLTNDSTLLYCSDWSDRHNFLHMTLLDTPQIDLHNAW